MSIEKKNMQACESDNASKLFLTKYDNSFSLQGKENNPGYRE